MNNQPVQQIRLVSGEEMLCEIMDYDAGEDNIIIRNAMSIETGLSDNSDRVYIFKPWFLYIENSADYIVLNTNHVIASSKPNDLLLLQYYDALGDMSLIANSRIKEHNAKEARKLKEIFEQISQLKESSEIESEEEKEGYDNVIPFPTMNDDDLIH